MTRAALLVPKHQGMRRDFIFSIAKGPLKLLDRAGTATGKNYRILSLKEVTDFVHWDLHEKRWFAIWGVVLQQVKEGLPISGYISAWA